MAKTQERHVKDLLKDFDTAMLVTRKSSSAVHARPMHIAEITENGTVYFATSKTSPKAQEIENDAHVTLIFQEKSKFIAMYGVASLVDDQKLIDRLWSETWKVWFPKGKSDPALTILKVSPDNAEYWDNEGLQGLSYVFSAAKAYMKGETPKTDADTHGKVAL
jgi:general stress protein 26